MFVRHAVTVICLSVSLFLSSLAGAFTLGKADLKSTLNQPLRAEIRLSNTKGLSAAEIIVGLAPIAEFEKAELGRVYFLNDVKFKVALNNSGGGIVYLTSYKPVISPFLSFVMEIR